MATIRRTLATLSISAIAIGVSARERQPGLGSAIGLEYSVQHDALRPLEDVSLLACLTNTNRHSRREVEPGDAFTFDFPAGTLHACSGTSVFSPDGSLDGVFDCAVVGTELRLTHVGASPVEWKFGDAACALVDYTTGSGPATIVPGAEVANAGAFLPASPGAILLSIAPGLGTAGPVGPSGPPGPPGPPGSAGVGAWAFVTSTGMVRTREGASPVIIPGLDVSVSIAAGSSIEVHVDATTEKCPEPPGEQALWLDTMLVLEVDGIEVARRGQQWERGGTEFPNPLLIHWTSGPLGAGPHRVRALIFMPSNPLGGSEWSACVGSAANDRDQARMLVKELSAAP